MLRNIAVPLALSALWVGVALAGASLRTPFGAVASLAAGVLFVVVHGLWGKSQGAEQRRRHIHLTLPVRSLLWFGGSVAGFLVFVLGYLIVRSWFVGPEVESNDRIMRFSLVASCLVVPFIEEVAFRGWMLRRTEAVLGLRRAALVSAFFFALLHLSLSGFPLRFAFGVLAAAAVHATGSLWSSILLHVLYNSFLLGLARIPQIDDLLGIGQRIPAVLGLGLGIAVLGTIGVGLTTWRLYPERSAHPQTSGPRGHGAARTE